MDTLIMVADLVLKIIKSEKYKNWKDESDEWFNIVLRYVEFTRQKLEIWMFVPCKLVGGVWIVLDEPYDYDNWLLFDAVTPKEASGGFLKHKEYQEAKERCLFEGIEYVPAKKEGEYSFLRITQLSQVNYPSLWGNYKIEDLIKYNLKLTKSAKAQINF